MGCQVTGVLRDYQETSKDALYASLGADSRRTLLYLPTGGGKTETAFSMIAEAVSDGHRVLVILDQITLARQWVKRAAKFGIGDVGILRGSDTDNLDAPLIIASAQTIDARRKTVATDEWLSGFTLVIVDECHVQRKAHSTAIDAVTENNGFAIGMTATPNAKGLREIYHNLVIGARIADLVPKYLVPCEVRVPQGAHGEYKAALRDVRVRAGEYHQTDLGEAMADERLTASALKVWQEHGDNRPTLVFCVDKAHAHAVGKQFETAGVRCAVLTEETPPDERDELIEAFTRRELTALISVNVLAVGFDAPIAQVGLMLRPTKSMMVWIQQAGRLLRPSEGKDKALLLDLAGNALELCHPMDYQPPKRLLGAKDDAEESTPPQRTCPECDAVIPIAVRECPECQYRFEAQDRERPGSGTSDVEMATLKRSTPANELSLRQAYLMFLHLCRERGQSDAGAYYRVIEFWSREHGIQLQKVPFGWKQLPTIEPVKAVIDFDRASRRAYAKKMNAEASASRARTRVDENGRTKINIRGW